MTAPNTPEGPKDAPGRLTWTVDEAAELLGVSRATAYEGVHSGGIPHIKVGRRILVPRVALEALLGSAGED